MPLITLRVECYPTEDPEKVRRAILNIFPDAVIEEMERGFMAQSRSISHFKEIIRNLRILDTTRGVMRRGSRGESTCFEINKQVAFMGKVSFVEEPVPLGSIQVVIEDANLEGLIDDVAPRTEAGEVVS